ncbi:MAG: endonuclease V [Caldisphaera sp.]|jgi:deoxyribonuclease V|nr:endonuclease V [Caldisphaera sp.]PMP60616.1 MAG: hypothetical protein C0201_02310 [Caldisphaera sp.]PMP89810.1 MAG: hypothetical protein C0171_06500 [Caldisphaera sp.]
MSSDGECESIRKSFNIDKAIYIQKEIISKKINFNGKKLNDLNGKIIAAVDASYWGYKEGKGIGIAVSFGYPEFNIIDCFATLSHVCIPYIPGLLAFREMYLLTPSLLNLIKRSKPDLIFVDGHGYAHPRFAGIASHIGVVFNIPTIGIAKKRLVGNEVKRNDNYELIYKDKIVGKILLINNKRIYISIGSNISLEDSFNIAKSMIYNNSIKPIYMADKISKIARKLYSDSIIKETKIIDCKKELIEKINLV